MFLPSPISCKTMSFLIISVQLVPVILLYDYISIAFNWLPYNPRFTSVQHDTFQKSSSLFNFWVLASPVMISYFITLISLLLFFFSFLLSTYHLLCVFFLKVHRCIVKSIKISSLTLLPTPISSKTVSFLSLSAQPVLVNLFTATSQSLLNFPFHILYYDVRFVIIVCATFAIDDSNESNKWCTAVRDTDLKLIVLNAKYSGSFSDLRPTESRYRKTALLVCHVFSAAWRIRRRTRYCRKRAFKADRPERRVFNL